MILDIIHETPSHLTADDIYSRVQQRISGVNKSTVYRTLELLEELDCVVRSEMGERFIYHHADEGHHHHLICRGCGRTIEMSEASLEPMRRKLLDELDFQVDIKHLVLHGLCADCRR